MSRAQTTYEAAARGKHITTIDNVSLVGLLRSVVNGTRHNSAVPQQPFLRLLLAVAPPAAKCSYVNTEAQEARYPVITQSALSTDYMGNESPQKRPYFVTHYLFRYA